MVVDILFTVAEKLVSDYVNNAYQYQRGRDSPSQTRNLILIVVTLTAAVTFQAGVNQPGGYWQDDSNEQVAGVAILASKKKTAYLLFLIFNTLAFSMSSTSIIITFTGRFPLRNEIWFSSLCIWSQLTRVQSLALLHPKWHTFRFYCFWLWYLCY